MSPLKRLRFFVPDFISGLHTALRVAREHDCERNGGHHWGDPYSSRWEIAMRDCSRCGCKHPAFVRPFIGANATTMAASLPLTWAEQ